MLRLLLAPGVGAVRLRRLIERCGGPGGAVRADYEHLRQVPGLGARELDYLARKQWDERQVDRQLELIEASETLPLMFWQEEYPAYLAQIYDPPPLLFVRGDPAWLNSACLAVVGTRTPSLYGREITRELTVGIAAAGYTVVSGLARGVDSLAHKTALDTGAPTVAVLGSGVDTIYPRENEDLVGRILGRGAVISEYPMGAPPEARNFPRRNRLISGLSRGVLVVEAGLKSGALITAEYAADQDREVFAVPGDVARGLSHGTNRLIQQGAKLVQSVEDILVEFGDRGPVSRRGDTQAELPGLTPVLGREERRVFDLLGREPLHVDELAEKAGMDVSRLLGYLLQLQMKRLVREHPGKLYSLG